MDACRRPLHRRRRRGQSLVVVALSATVLFGIIALGIDGGRLYFARRDVQNAADGGALAAAIDLIPPAVNTEPDYRQARYDALKYAFNQFPFTASWGTLNPNPSSCDPCQTATYNGVAIAATTKVNGEPNRIQVDVQWTLSTTFASLIGFNQATVVATAQALGGFRYATYAVFGFDTIGTGNSVDDDQNGWAQIDDGVNPSGSDACSSSADGQTVSNAKWHAPNPGQPGINVNGFFAHGQASDDHQVRSYWQDVGLRPSVATQPQPNYQPPAVGGLSPGSTDTYVAGNTVTIGAVQFTASRPTTVFHPGWYENLTLDDATRNYVFANGVYDMRGAFAIMGGHVGNTRNAVPSNPGVSDLPPAPDGTNGVEFVFEPSGASFSATGGFVSLVSPKVIPPPATNRIVMFFKGTSLLFGSGTSPRVFSETIPDRTTPANPATSYFHLWGTVFDDNLNGTQGSSIELKAVSQAEYAITGQFIGPNVLLRNGGLTSTPGTGWANGAPLPGTCPTLQPPYKAGSPGLLVQFKKEYAPSPLHLSILVK
jgi:Flp pilus assembly protein TadG